MIHIEIEIPRPFMIVILLLGIAGVFGVSYANQDAILRASAGGEGVAQEMVVHNAENDVHKLRVQQAVLERKQEILRYQLQSLEQALQVTGMNEAMLQQLRESREELLSLMRDQQKAEQEILASFRQIWSAEHIALDAGQGSIPSTARFLWPVEPAYGLSARFHDSGYEERFGLPHNAIDIPTEQGTTVVAPIGGVVEKVSDNGLGFNSLVIRHDGFATLYGHVEAFLVQEGDTVQSGQPIALSGGTPGTAGAGRLTTGPHLHFEVIANGEHVDPLQYLPALK